MWDGDGVVWSVTSERLVRSGGLRGTNAATICPPSGLQKKAAINSNLKLTGLGRLST